MAIGLLDSSYSLSAAGRKPTPSKIPISAQSKRTPQVSPEALRAPEPAGELVPVREMELARIRQQLELDLELGRRRLLERERLAAESDQRLAALKGYWPSVGSSAVR